jgi:histidyl-tRNA synthetase
VVVEGTRSAAQLTGGCGAYALLLVLDRSVELPRRFDRRRLPKGCYCYVGSARGAGGIRGRCARHLRAPLTSHWHIDWLLASALDRVLMGFPGQQECEVLARLLAIEGASVPVPGFGGADCRRCPSHLLALDRPVWPHFPIASSSARQASPFAGGEPTWRC